MPSVKNASSSSPASSHSHNVWFKGELERGSQDFLRRLNCLLLRLRSLRTVGMPRVILATTRQLHACSYTQLLKLHPLALLKLRQIVRPSLVVETKLVLRSPRRLSGRFVSCDLGMGSMCVNDWSRSSKGNYR